MAWMRIREYQERFSPNSRPDRRTVVARIQRGELVGRCEGGIWYVDPDKEPAPPTLYDVAEKLFTKLSARV